MPAIYAPNVGWRKREEAGYNPESVMVIVRLFPPPKLISLPMLISSVDLLGFGAL